MPKIPRLEFHVSVIHSPVMGANTVNIQGCLEGQEPTTSTHTIGAGQLFLRLQEHVNNHLKRLCSQMEDQLKTQRKNK